MISFGKFDLIARYVEKMKQLLLKTYILTVNIYLRLLYMLEWTGKPYWSLSTSSVYTQVPPMLFVCSNATHLNCECSAVKFFKAARPDAPQPMIPTDFLYVSPTGEDIIIVISNTYWNEQRANFKQPRNDVLTGNRTYRLNRRAIGRSWVWTNQKQSATQKQHTTGLQRVQDFYTSTMRVRRNDDR